MVLVPFHCFYSYNIGIVGVKIKGQSEKSFVCFQWLVIFIFLKKQ